MTVPLTPDERLRRAGVIIEVPAIENAGENVRMLPVKPSTKAKGEPAPLPLLWFDEIEPVLESNDIVQGILSKTTSSVAYGESNAGKTFLVSDMALHIAAGMPWLGRRVEQGGVIYCVLEGGHGFRNRVVAWRRKHRLDGEGIPFAAIPAALNLLDLLNPDADVFRLIKAIQAAAEKIDGPVSLVVIDTLSRAIAGGNENSSEDMTALVRAMDTIKAETGAAVLFIHHCGKDAAKGARGHSSLRAAIDTEIEVKADEEAGLNTATVVKQRDKKKGDVLTFKLAVEVLGQNEYDEDVTTCVVEGVGEAETVRPAKKSRSLTSKEAGWFKDLVDGFAEPDAAKMFAPVPGMTPVPTLTRDQVREGFKRRGRFTLDKGALTNGDRGSLHSMLNSLKDKGKIAMTADFVWLL